ncbi:hypothetical protein KJ891_02450 [Candidatus Micrarchaeota archaeon]|nr:hypothetical protein [Candidatus Micrarchaeota archaeon]
MNTTFNTRSLLYIIIALGILAHLFSLVILPEAAYADSFYHVMLSQDVMGRGTLDLPLSQWAVPPPLYYLIFSSTFFLSGLPIDQYTIKILPFFFAAIQLLLFFLISRKIFAQNWLAPFALFSIFPLVIRYGSVNYTENLSLIFVLAGTCLILRLREHHAEKTALAMIPIAVSIAALSISKLNGTVLVPVLILAAVYFLYRNRAANIKFSATSSALFFIALALLLSGLWFGMNFLKFGTIDRFSGEQDIINTETAISGILGNVPYYLSIAYIQFWDFPPVQVFPPNAVLPMALLFALVVLPLYIALKVGGYCLLVKRRKYFLGALAFLTTAIFAAIVIGRTFDATNWYTRLIFPIVPFVAILFGYGWLELSKRKWLGRAVLLSLLLFSVYSLAFTSYTALFYANDHSDNSPLYTQIALLPADVTVAIKSNLTKAVPFISGRAAIGKENRFDSASSPELYSSLRLAGVTHIATVCRNDPWDKALLQELERAGKLREIFNENCSALYVLEQ